MRRLLLAFAAGLAVMAIAGWWFSYRDLRTDEPSIQSDHSIAHTTTTIPVGEAVTDIRRLNRLVVFRAYVTAITTTHEVGWFTQADQTMITPAYVNYFIDLSELKPGDVATKDNQIVIKRPVLRIERPNIDTLQIRTFNEGVWSTLSSTADRLRAANSRMALRQLYGRAQMPFLSDAARDAANAAVAANIQQTLAADGHPGMVVRVIR